MRCGGPGPTGYALTNRHGEPSLSRVRNYKWRWSVVCELRTLSDAWNLGPRRALDRLAEEAVHVGADAVVGVQDAHAEGAVGVEFSNQVHRENGAGAPAPPIKTQIHI